MRSCLSPHPWATTSKDSDNLPAPWLCLGGQGRQAVGEDTADAVAALLFPRHPSRHSWKHFPGHIPALWGCSAGYFSSRARAGPQGDIPPSAVTPTVQGAVARAGGQPLARVFPGTFLFLCSRGSA